MPSLKLPADCKYIANGVHVRCLMLQEFRVVPADGQLHYSGVSLPSPWHDYPQGRLPDTLVMRRCNAQTALQGLLIKHPTAANITMLAATVRSFQAVPDMTSLQSVTVRKLDGTVLQLNDVALVAGRIVLPIQRRVLTVSQTAPDRLRQVTSGLRRPDSAFRTDFAAHTTVT